MEVSDIAILLTALGAGGILLKLVERGLDALKGTGRKRRDEVDRAWRRVDREASRRRRIEEHASRLVRMLTAAPCVEPDDIPPWPGFTDTDTDTISKENH